MTRTDTFFRWFFYFVFLSGGAIFWLAKHPPMADLPQHAGQVMLLHDLILHRSPWESEVRINFFTPYWIGYGLATVLSFAMPVGVALKLQLTLAYYAFVGALIFVRRRLGGDPRLDWLFLIGWFGYAYEYGFFTFLVAAPLAVLYIEWARSYAVLPSWRRGWVLLGSGVVLFFCHGLIFLFANAIGGVNLLVRYRRNLLGAWRVFWPYALLGGLCLTYFLAHRDVDIKPMYSFSVIWQLSWIRLVGICIWPWGIVPKLALALGFSYFLLFAVGLLRVRVNPRFEAAIPLIIVLLVQLFVPHFAMNTFFLYQRFGLFTFPFLALALVQANQEAASQWHAKWMFAGQAILAAVCVGFLGVQAVDAIAFEKESQAYDAVTQALKPGQRVLSLVWDKGSLAADNFAAYQNFAAWYQAEKQGFVDFNFAWFPPQVVRFKLDRLPAAGPSQLLELDTSKLFKPDDFQIWKYKYLLVRGSNVLSGQASESRHCKIVLLDQAEPSSAYEIKNCH
jgi:hypothetical protein